MEQQILNLYFEEKLKQKEIAEKLKISKYKVSRTVRKDERYINEKETRKENSQIRHRENTINIINKQRKEQQMKNGVDNLTMKRIHNQASFELSDRKRLNNITYRNWNKSAFKYNSKRKGYEFKEDELGRSYDVPKFIKVEV